MSAFLHLCLFVIAFPACMLFLFYRRKPLPARLSRLLVIGVPIGLLAAGILWLSWGRYIPGQSARLFQGPISDFQYIQIKPDPNFSLVNRPLIVANKVEIKGIITAIRSATPYEPNHPTTRWACTLIISGLHSDCYVRVANTPPGGYSQGTILECMTSEDGLIYSTLRSDTMGDILEKVARNSQDDLADVGWRNSRPPTFREMIFGLSLMLAASVYHLAIFALVVVVAVYLFAHRKHHLSR